MVTAHRNKHFARNRQCHSVRNRKLFLLLLYIFGVLICYTSFERYLNGNLTKLKANNFIYLQKHEKPKPMHGVALFFNSATSRNVHLDPRSPFNDVKGKDVLHDDYNVFPSFKFMEKPKDVIETGSEEKEKISESQQKLPIKPKMEILLPRTQRKAVSEKLLSIRMHPIKNKLNFTFTDQSFERKPSFCEDNNRLIPDDFLPGNSVFICITSFVENVGIRQFIRKQYKNNFFKLLDHVYNMTLLFFVGVPQGDSKGKIQRTLDKEMKKYGDVIQSTLIESSENKWKRSLPVLLWTSRLCLKPRFVVKAEENVQFNLPMVMTELEKMEEEKPLFMLGKLTNVFKTPPGVRPSNKLSASLPDWVYGNKKKADYLDGTLGVSFPTSVARLLLEASMRVNPLRHDDIFVTKVCAEMAGVPVLDSWAYLFAHSNSLNDG